MRTIDADSIQRRICGAKCGCEYEDCGNEGDCGYDHFISNAPTINAVPVVRCRECKWWQEDDDIGHCDNPDGLDNYAKPEDFCPYGEKRRDKDGTT